MDPDSISPTSATRCYLGTKLFTAPCVMFFMSFPVACFMRHFGSALRIGSVHAVYLIKTVPNMTGASIIGAVDWIIAILYGLRVTGVSRRVGENRQDR